MMCEPWCLTPARFLSEFSYRDLRLLNVELAYRVVANGDAH